MRRPVSNWQSRHKKVLQYSYHPGVGVAIPARDKQRVAPQVRAHGGGVAQEQAPAGDRVTILAFLEVLDDKSALPMEWVRRNYSCIQTESLWLLHFLPDTVRANCPLA